MTHGECSSWQLMFYKFITNTDLVDTEPLVLEEMQSYGAVSWSHFYQ